MPPTADAAALLARLRALPIEVEAVTCTVAEVAEPSYPGGRRPSATVQLAGHGCRGDGEHVAWTLAEHTRLRDTVADGAPRGRSTLGEWAAVMRRQVAEPYARAALEAAAIDLALRQQALTLFALAGSAPQPVRYIVSFDRRPDPAAEMVRLRRDAPGLEFKIDADPAWDDAVYAALAAAGGVAVVDFKGDGDATAHARAHRFLPAALLEDPGAGPWTNGVRVRISMDAPVRRAADIATLPVRPAAVNIKPARMGGVLEALAAVAACQQADIPVYFGGMFEVGVGRRQLHVLAALFAPDGPNDVAPLGATIERPARLVVTGERPGFGSV